MHKFLLIAASISFATAAQAGPLAAAQKGPLAMPRIASMARPMPALGAMPSLKAGPALAGLAPCLNNVCIPAFDLPPVSVPGWLHYDVTAYPKVVSQWATAGANMAVVIVQETVYEAQHPCEGTVGGTGCNTEVGGQNVPIGLVTGQVGVASNFANKALGLVGGGIGPIPLPKLPGDE